MTPTPFPVALAPKDAVARYIAGGMTTKTGMPNVNELESLLAMNAATRFAWAKEVGAEFDRQLPAPVPDHVLASNETEVVDSATVDDVGTLPDTGIRPEAQVYLIEVSQGFPYVGLWNWTRLASTVIAGIPQIVAVAPPVAAVPATPTSAAVPAMSAVVVVQTKEGFFTHLGTSLHDAITNAVQWIETELKRL